MHALPNAITLLRIVLSVALCFLFRQRIAFLVVYTLCGLSDALDGWLARRLHAATALGAKLDSLADLVFFGVSMVSLLFLVRETVDTRALVLLCIVAAVRVVNLGVTKGRFGQWGILHTLGNKLAGLALFVSIPVCIFAGGFPSVVIYPLFAIAILSAGEELCILATSPIYDPNRRGLLWKQ